MDKCLIDEVIECLPKGRTKYHYYKDRYALMLLSYQIGQGMKVADIKKSNLNKLLQRPQVKKLLANISNDFVNADALDGYWPSDVNDDLQNFVLTLSHWGGEVPRWQQTSRHGYNLVVQLNFSNAHNSLYRDMVKPCNSAALNYYGHPVLRTDGIKDMRETLAWARLDIDFDTNEVLIEEIQSDWVREARDMLRDAEEAISCDDNSIPWWGIEGKTENVIKYVNEVLMPYTKTWDEAMLAATLEFVKNELGIRRVYYHSYESGSILKTIEGNSPRNLYTRLPKRFCFEETDESPVFLQHDRHFRKAMKKMVKPVWYRLDLEEVNRYAYCA